MNWHWFFVISVVQVLYLVIGGVIFHYLESANEVEVRTQTLNFQQSFLENYTCLTREAIVDLMENLETAFSQGISLSNNESITHNWDIGHAISFCITLVTTIGYGNLTPSTDGGRAFCMFYAIGGIPMTLVILAHMGSKISYVNKLLADKINLCTNKKLDAVMDSMLVATLGLVFVLLIPAVYFHITEGWSYIHSCYFVVITLSTVGFGDLVPYAEGEHQAYYEALFLTWTIFGLAWFAGVIDTIRKSVERTVDITQSRVTVLASNVKVNMNIYQVAAHWDPVKGRITCDELTGDLDTDSTSASESSQEVIRVEEESLKGRNIFLTPTEYTCKCSPKAPRNETICIHL